jgi:hypothetical protein
VDSSEIRSKPRLSQFDDRLCIVGAKSGILPSSFSLVPTSVSQSTEFINDISVVVPFLRDLQNGKNKAANFVMPLIVDRKQQEEDYNYKKPVQFRFSWLTQADFLQWLMDFGTGEAAKPKEVITRILFMNFASIHTTLMVMHRILKLTADVHPCFILSGDISRVCATTSRGDRGCRQS